MSIVTIRRELRTCHLCTYNVLGCEYHYLLECPHFLENRSQHVPDHFFVNPNMHKLSDLMNNETSSILCNLAKFCKIII